MAVTCGEPSPPGTSRDCPQQCRTIAVGGVGGRCRDREEGGGEFNARGRNNEKLPQDQLAWAVFLLKTPAAPLCPWSH